MLNDLSPYALVAGIGGIIGGIVQFVLNTYFSRFVNSAQLKMEFNANNHMRYTFSPNGVVYTIRLRVWNENVFVAKNCRVYLLSLCEIGSRTKHIDIHETLQLPWEMDGQLKWAPVDLPKGAAFNVVMLEVINRYLEGPMGVQLSSQDRHLKTQKGTFDYKERIKSDTEYFFKLVVTAENAEPFYIEASVIVCVKLDGRPMRLWNVKGYYLSRIMSEMEASRISWSKTKMLIDC